MLRFFLLLCICYPVALFGQVGSSTNYWSWSEPSKEESAIVKIKCSTDSLYNYMPGAYGTGSVIKHNNHLLIISSGHICAQQFKDEFVPVAHEKIEVIFGDESISEASVVLFDLDNDLVVLKTNIPETHEFIEVANQPAEWKDEVEVLGLGGCGFDSKISNIRHFDTKISFGAGPFIVFIECPVVMGDSGGIVISKETRKLVGVIMGSPISNGYQIFFENGKRYYAVWPPSGPGQAAIKKILNRSTRILLKQAFNELAPFMKDNK